MGESKPVGDGQPGRPAVSLHSFLAALATRLAVGAKAGHRVNASMEDIAEGNTVILAVCRECVRSHWQLSVYALTKDAISEYGGYEMTCSVHGPHCAPAFLGAYTVS